MAFVKNPVAIKQVNVVRDPKIYFDTIFYINYRIESVVINKTQSLHRGTYFFSSLIFL